MEKEEKQTVDFFLQLKKNWAVVVVIVSIISSWTYFQFQLNNLSEKQNTNVSQTSYDALVARVTAVELKVSAIDEVAGDIKGINAKLDIILKKIQL